MTHQLPLVRVLLATFNGRSFLEEQIRSILMQENSRIQIDVLDDGSTDGTLDILDRMLTDGRIHSLKYSNRIGSSAAFMRLLVQAEEADYYAFSDQDDIWKSTKISEQVSRIIHFSPTLVICGRSLIDSQGSTIYHREQTKVSPSFENALVENIAYGNTQLINLSLRALINTRVVDVKYIDSWIYLIASVYGEINRIETNLVQYRIHANNSIGLGKKGIKEVITSIKDFRDQAELFISSFDSMPNDKKELLQKFLKSFQSKFLIQRIYYSIRSPARRQSLLENLAWKLIAPFVGKNHNDQLISTP